MNLCHTSLQCRRSPGSWAILGLFLATAWANPALPAPPESNAFKCAESSTPTWWPSTSV